MGGRSEDDMRVAMDVSTATQEKNQKEIFEKLDKVSEGVSRLIIIEERETAISTALERFGKRLDNLGAENKKIKEKISKIELDSLEGIKFRNKVQTWIERAGLIGLASYFGLDKFID